MRNYQEMLEDRIDDLERKLISENAHIESKHLTIIELEKKIKKLESLKTRADEMAEYYFKGESQVGSVGPARRYLELSKELDNG